MKFDKTSPFLSKNFLLGIVFLGIAIFGCRPVTHYFYYGGGWPFVPLSFLILYLLGLRYVFRSKVHLTIKLLLGFGWIIYVAVTSWGEVSYPDE